MIKGVVVGVEVVVVVEVVGVVVIVEVVVGVEVWLGLELICCGKWHICHCYCHSYCSYVNVNGTIISLSLTHHQEQVYLLHRYY